jgi:hypothetical protein
VTKLLRRRVNNGARRGPQPENGGVKFTPTPEQRHAVACMISVGTPHEAIARALDISQPTMYRHFAHEVKNGKAAVHAAIAKRITAMALSGDKTMMIFFAKSQMGWRDSYRVDFEDKNGEPANMANLFTINITGLTPK